MEPRPQSEGTKAVGMDIGSNSLQAPQLTAVHIFG